ncbi:hypothetical protein ILUMI_20363 [Ignelater luminosus]|uniref:AIP/AIPL N-terminal FKBP-type PPIase domain-containing protein n=1 Tax=Ignelater luminosus TaxID=2038154 RepID=A0A8K0CIM0_IGNLU|nr:hypothetical protein ILUMI_20363 [Ignelater luminosus]
MEHNPADTGILKKILYAGTKPATFKDGAKVFFHFQTRLCNEEKTFIDDSRKMGPGKPLELVLGKKFKLEVWEAILQRMTINEVAQYTVSKNLVGQYPFVSKTLREAHIPPDERKSHCCAMTLQQEGIGHDDLNNLLKNPCNLEFTIELLKVEHPDEYQKEAWQMNEEEQLIRVQELKEKGNEVFKKGELKSAADMYAEAIGILERLLLREKPQSEEWLELNKLKLPLLLNFSQCKLNEGDFYAVIEHCSTVLKTDPDNIKALYRRGKAHVGAWNPTEAKNDFNRVLELDSSVKGAVKKELETLEQLIKAKDKADKEKLRNLFDK